MTIEHEWTEDMQAVLGRDATRRPRSRYAAGVLTRPQSEVACEIIDEAIEQLELLKRQIRRHAQQDY